MDGIAIKLNTTNRAFFKELCEILKASPYNFNVALPYVSIEHGLTPVLQASHYIYIKSNINRSITFGYNEELSELEYINTEHMGELLDFVFDWLEDINIDTTSLFGTLK